VKSTVSDVNWPEVKTLLRKWINLGLTESDAHRLLTAWSGAKTPKTLEMRDAERSQTFNWKLRRDGLRWAGIRFRKDVRTIRRWCEEGFFSEASQTPGGHWRIPPDHVDVMCLCFPDGGGRKPRRIFGTKAWKEFRSTVAPVLVRRLPELFVLETAIRDEIEAGLLAGVDQLSDESLEHLRKHPDVQKNANYLLLRNMAKRLFQSAPHQKLTYRDLARGIGRSPATLYRKFGKNKINSAIRGAEIQLQKPDADEENSGSQWDEIQEMFQGIRVHDVQSPYLFNKDIDERE
jgi:hypothetical protein